MDQSGSEESEIIEPITRINSIRQQLGISLAKNIAFADFKIGSDRDFLIAVSGKKTRQGTVDLPNFPFFRTFEFPPGHSRAYDSEYKLLEELASRYSQNPTITGTVNIFTERSPCVSCSFVIEQFQQLFVNITLTVNDPDSLKRNQ